MKIHRFVDSVPAGILNVPMVVTAIINTFWPQALLIGGTTTGLFKTGTVTLIGLILFICGTQFRLNQVIPTFKRGFILLVTKVIIGVGGAWIVLRYLPIEGIWGMSAIALIAALASTNPGTYLAICMKHGDETDRAAYGPLNVISPPAIAIFYMSVGGASAGLDYMSLIQVLVPFLLGMLIGNLDDEYYEICKPGYGIVLPFMGFCFGSAIDLRIVWSSAGSGLLLTALVIIVNIPILFFVDRCILRRPGYASFGVAAAAAISVTVPALYAAVDPAYEPYASVAAAQIGMVVIITSFLMPWLAGFFPGEAERHQDIAKES